MPYRNPILPGFHPDPSVCRVGEDFYLAVSSFEYFPGVPLFHSRDLVNWRPIGHALTRASQLDLTECPPSSGVWAPTLRYHEGTFYLITTNYNSRARGRAGKFLVTATDPEGPWSEPVWIDQPGIDPSLLFDDDGKVYLTSNEAFSGLPIGIYQAEIDVRTGVLLTENRLIWEGMGGIYPEGPHLYHIGEWYYLLLSEGGSQMGHYVTVGRSRSPWGPFEGCPRSPILTHRDRSGQGHPIQGTGHGDLVQAADGSWWMLYLAFRHSKPFFYHLGRETFLSPVRWDSDGWPVLVNPGRPDGTTDLRMDVETLPTFPWPEEPVRDPLRVLGPRWSFLRNPEPGSWHVGDDGLRLRGGGGSLGGEGSPAMVCRRQQHFDCRVATRLHSVAREAGLTVYYQPEHHYDFHVTPVAVVLRKTIGDVSAVVAEHPRDPSEVLELEIVADRDLYRFVVCGSGGERIELGTARTQFVSTEATVCSFTGVMIGMYAVGGDATFEWFDYQELHNPKESGNE